MDGWFLDGMIWRADVELSTTVLPYSLRCSYANGLVETHGPGLGTWLGWAVAVAMALIATLRFRGRAAARGLAGSLAVLAAYGYLASNSVCSWGRRSPRWPAYRWPTASTGGCARADRRLHSCLIGAGTAAAIERVERLDELLLRPAREGLADPP